MMNNYKHMMIMLKALYLSSYNTAVEMYEATSGEYHRGFIDAIDLCLDQLTRAIEMADKEQSNDE